MSPILTRPVREQLEHDRVIRQLQARYKRKNEVIINPGNEQNQSITVGELVVFPDLLLFAEGGRRLLGTVEVETGESVNAIEARAEWGVYSKLKVPLHLYVPPVCVDAAKRICAEYQIRRRRAVDLHDVASTRCDSRWCTASPDAPVAKVPVKVAKPAPPSRSPAPKAAPAASAEAGSRRKRRPRRRKPRPQSQAAGQKPSRRSRRQAKAKPSARRSAASPRRREEAPLTPCRSSD